MTEVTQFMATGGGERSCGFSDSEVNILVTPQGTTTNARALEIATALAERRADPKVIGLQNENADLQARIERISDVLARTRLRAERGESRLESALTGRRQFFGPVLARPAVAGDWSGEIFLLDPVKQEQGRALAFASMKALRLAHPELWIVDVTSDGILMDGWDEQ